jgi:hypothetical protein
MEIQPNESQRPRVKQEGRNFILHIPVSPANDGELIIRMIYVGPETMEVETEGLTPEQELAARPVIARLCREFLIQLAARQGITGELHIKYKNDPTWS